jgi:hypothetical protein
VQHSKWKRCRQHRGMLLPMCNSYTCMVHNQSVLSQSHVRLQHCCSAGGGLCTQNRLHSSVPPGQCDYCRILNVRLPTCYTRWGAGLMALPTQCYGLIG